MDRKIEPTKGIRKLFTRKALPYWGGALLLVFIGWLLLRDNASRLRTNGDTFTVQGKSGNWWKVEYKGKSAYIHKNYVKIS